MAYKSGPSSMNKPFDTFYTIFKDFDITSVGSPNSSAAASSIVEETKITNSRNRDAGPPSNSTSAVPATPIDRNNIYTIEESGTSLNSDIQGSYKDEVNSTTHISSSGTEHGGSDGKYLSPAMNALKDYAEFSGRTMIDIGLGPLSPVFGDILGDLIFGEKP